MPTAGGPAATRLLGCAAAAAPCSARERYTAQHARAAPSGTRRSRAALRQAQHATATHAPRRRVAKLPATSPGDVSTLERGVRPVARAPPGRLVAMLLELESSSLALAWVVDYLRALRTGRLRPYSFCERKTRAATRGSVPWGPTGEQLRELAAASYEPANLAPIFAVLSSRLRTPDKWRKTYKALVVLEWLATRGSPAAAARACGMRFLLEELRTYRFVDPDTGTDQGARPRGASARPRRRRACAGLAAGLCGARGRVSALGELTRGMQASTFGTGPRPSWRCLGIPSSWPRCARRRRRHTGAWSSAEQARLGSRVCVPQGRLLRGRARPADVRRPAPRTRKQQFPATRPSRRASRRRR
jgi:hypothetical protein